MIGQAMDNSRKDSVLQEASMAKQVQRLAKVKAPGCVNAAGKLGQK